MRASGANAIISTKTQHTVKLAQRRSGGGAGAVTRGQNSHKTTVKLTMRGTVLDRSYASRKKWPVIYKTRGILE